MHKLTKELTAMVATNITELGKHHDERNHIKEIQATTTSQARITNTYAKTVTINMLSVANLQT